jgi:hypothetical protein
MEGRRSGIFTEVLSSKLCQTKKIIVFAASRPMLQPAETDMLYE